MVLATDKYELLTNEDLLERSVLDGRIKHKWFYYSLLRKAFDELVETMKYQDIKELKIFKNMEPCPAIKKSDKKRIIYRKFYNVIKKNHQNLLYISERGKYCSIRGHFTYLDQRFKG